MQVPEKHHKRRLLFTGGSENSCVRHRAQHKDHVWSYDFVSDKIDGKVQFRMLVIIDEFTWERLAIEVALSFTAQ